jgi:multiple sugar transport system permease protein
MAHTASTKSEKATLAARRTGCYIALVLISFLCLFFFYVLVINSTRTHFEIQKGFSLLPGKSLMTNLKNVLNDANIPVLTGVRNSLIVSACSAALSVYFSALTAYGIYAYNFRFKKAAFAIILLIMTMPTQVSALGFLQLITKMGLKNSFLPLIIPSIAAPAVFFFMKQYLDASLPMEIVEAARIDGAGEFYTFNKIVLPIMKPALAVQAIFAFVSSWNNYFIPALVLDTADKKTLPILIAQLPRWYCTAACKRSMPVWPAVTDSGASSMTKAVQLQMTIVSTRTPSAWTSPILTGSSQSAAAAAQGAEPLPASLENRPRLMPFIRTAPKPPAATCRRPKASEKMLPSTAGRWVILVAMT